MHVSVTVPYRARASSGPSSSLISSLAGSFSFSLSLSSLSPVGDERGLFTMRSAANSSLQADISCASEPTSEELDPSDPSASAWWNAVWVAAAPGRLSSLSTRLRPRAALRVLSTHTRKQYRIHTGTGKEMDKKCTQHRYSLTHTHSLSIYISLRVPASLSFSLSSFASCSFSAGCRAYSSVTCATYPRSALAHAYSTSIVFLCTK